MLEAELADRDATELVAAQWAAIEEELAHPQLASSRLIREWVQLLPLIKEIRAHPDLNRLSFFRSHDFLCLNRCTKYPYCDGYPAAHPGHDGRIDVYT